MKTNLQEKAKQRLIDALNNALEELADIRFRFWIKSNVKCKTFSPSEEAKFVERLSTTVEGWVGNAEKMDEILCEGELAVNYAKRHIKGRNCIKAGKHIITGSKKTLDSFSQMIGKGVKR